MLYIIPTAGGTCWMELSTIYKTFMQLWNFNKLLAPPVFPPLFIFFLCPHIMNLVFPNGSIKFIWSAHCAKNATVFVSLPEKRNRHQSKARGVKQTRLMNSWEWIYTTASYPPVWSWLSARGTGGVVITVMRWGISPFFFFFLHLTPFFAERSCLQNGKWYLSISYSKHLGAFICATLVAHMMQRWLNIAELTLHAGD